MSDGGVTFISVEPRVESDEDVQDAERQKEAAKRTYAQSVAVTKEVINSVRLGRTANVKKVKRAVQAIVDQVLNNEASLVGLTTLRDYDEYTFTHSVNVCIFSVALGQEAGVREAAVVRPRHGGAVPRRRQVARAARRAEQGGRPVRRRVAHHDGPPLARRAHAVRDPRLRRDSVPGDDRGLRASHEDRPDRVSQVDPAARDVDLLEDRGGRRRLRRRDEPARVPDRPDSARPGAQGDVGESAARL